MLYRAIFKYVGEESKNSIEDKLNHYEINDEVTRTRMNKDFNSIITVSKLTWMLNRKDKYGQLMMVTNLALNNHDIFRINEWFKNNYEFEIENIDCDFIFEQEDYVSEVG
jgi:hypothetical protein